MSVTVLRVPDIGDFSGIPIIEVHVKPGDRIKRDDPLITLESDKAAMEVPAPEDGEVAELLVKVGDKVSQGSAILRLTSGKAVAPGSASCPAAETATVAAGSSVSLHSGSAVQTVPISPSRDPIGTDFSGVHASPSVRRLARELDIDLTAVTGTGEKGRVTKDDVKRAVAGGGAVTGGAGIPEIPPQDFAKFGATETIALSRIQRLSGPQLHRAWLNVPHVTHSDWADITGLDAYRKTLDAAARDKGYRVTLLSFLLKASVVVLKEFPVFNASLAPDKASLILKHYYNIGVAVETQSGLVVPVLRDLDRKGILETSQELSAVSQRMREGKIAPADIQGGTFSISSLGGIGGTAFTPIVNVPEVAILGVVKAEIHPRWDGNVFQPRLMLPLCVSYDHRVIDGAMAARFTRRLAAILEDVREMVL